MLTRMGLRKTVPSPASAHAPGDGLRARSEDGPCGLATPPPLPAGALQADASCIRPHAKAPKTTAIRPSCLKLQFVLAPNASAKINSSLAMFSLAERRKLRRSAGGAHDGAAPIPLFALAAVAEIGEARLVWQGMREQRGLLFVTTGVVALGCMDCRHYPTRPHFGRILAAYSGVFVAESLVRGVIVDGFDPIATMWAARSCVFLGWPSSCMRRAPAEPPTLAGSRLEAGHPQTTATDCSGRGCVSTAQCHIRCLRRSVEGTRTPCKAEVTGSIPVGFTDLTRAVCSRGAGCSRRTRAVTTTVCAPLGGFCRTSPTVPVPRISPGRFGGSGLSRAK